MEQVLMYVRQRFISFFGQSCSAQKVGMIGGILFAGWLGGTLVSGFLTEPSTLNAAMTETKPVLGTHQAQSNGFADVAKMVRPAVVHMTVTHHRGGAIPDDAFRDLPDWLGRQFSDRMPDPPSGSPRGMGTGSGVLISADGHVITNHHVVEGANRVTVTLLDKRQFDGRVIGLDAKTDLALVKIEGHDLPHLTWGDSSRLQVGDYVLAVGNPFGLSATVTQGIVSALGRGGMGITQYEDFIQTDAAINPGNSGGALVDARGELVGINTAIFSRTGGYQGIGFAVPSSMAQVVSRSLLKDGKVVRGYLGVGIQELTPDLAQTFHLSEANGALVTDVKPGSPAAKGGLKRGDTIVQYQDTPIDSPRALQREVMKTRVGTAITMTVVRDGDERTIRATITEQSPAVRLAKGDVRTGDRLAGLTVDELDPITARRLGIGNIDEGVVVTNVQPGSSAERAGLTRGDVIREVNRIPISSLHEYERVATSLKEGHVALFLIERRGAPLFLSVKV